MTKQSFASSSRRTETQNRCGGAPKGERSRSAYVAQASSAWNAGRTERKRGNARPVRLRANAFARQRVPRKHPEAPVGAPLPHVW